MMKKPNITEGEWEVIEDKRIGKSGKTIHRVFQIRRVNDESDSGKVTQWNGLAKAASPKGHANAKAISAVPDMIDALIEAYKEASDYKLSKETASKIEQALTKAGITINETGDR